MNAYVKESALVPLDDLTSRIAPVARIASVRPLAIAMRAVPSRTVSYRRPVPFRLGVLAAVVLLQVGLFTMLGMNRVAPRETPQAPIFLIDIPSTPAEPPRIAPKPPVFAAPVMNLPRLEMPEIAIAPAPNAITLPPSPPPQAAVPTGGDTGVDVVRNYQAVLLRHLAQHKRYPAAARSRRAQGVALVRFTMDRAGQVLSVALTKTSGAEMLDSESVALLSRAAPLPAPPPEVRGNAIEMIVPIEFTLR